jgi:kynurenine 3-monooxygenase
VSIVKPVGTFRFSWYGNQVSKCSRSEGHILICPVFVFVAVVVVMFGLSFVLRFINIALVVVVVVAVTAENQPHAVVIGAGPAGLSSALILARNHGYRVTILEKNTKESYTDDTRAYSYAINFRGQALTKRLPLVQELLEQRGVAAQEFAIVRVPGNPTEIFDANKLRQQKFKLRADVNYYYYHISRHILCKILIQAVEEEANIKIVWGGRCESLAPNTQGIVDVQVTVTPNTDADADISKQELGNSLFYSASLVVGADGINSFVRDSLSQPNSPFASWTSNNDPTKFRLKKCKSPSYGLRVKVRIRIILHIGYKVMTFGK